MADILLRGFEMPTDASLWLLIRPDGTVHKLKVGGKHGEPQQGVAVPLPEGHGRLVDVDKLTPDMGYFITGGSGTVGSMCSLPAYSQQQIDDAPTIVPSEGGGEDG